MTVTGTYTRAHEVFKQLARELGVAPHDVRLLMAIHEAHEGVRMDELAAMLGNEGTATRRSALVLYDRGLARGWPRKTGTTTRLALTEAGRTAARTALQETFDGLAAAA